VVVWLTIRRFDPGPPRYEPTPITRSFCDHVDCSACTFVEQVPGLAERHARRNVGLQAALVAIALVLAGRAGSRLAAISIRENKMSSVTLLRRLGNHSRKNRLYRAFRELGRAIRTITLLRYLSDPALREQITQVTNRNEAFPGFADWLMFGGKLIGCRWSR